MSLNLDALYREINPLDLHAPTAASDNVRDYFRYYGINFEESRPGTRHHFGRFQVDNFDIVAHAFFPPEPRASCFIFTGYYDHAGLYRHVIEFCLQQQFAVFIYDLPGHGLSSGERVSIADFQCYQAVMRHALLQFQSSLPAPFYAIGQSTGGAMLMQYLLTEPEPVFDKVVLLAPLVRPANWHLSLLLYHLASPFLDRVKRPRLTNSGDADFMRFLNYRDPLQTWHLPVCWVRAMMAWKKQFEQLASSEFELLVVQGDADRTVDWRYDLQVIRRRFPRARELLLSGAQHHLANELPAYREKYFAAMAMYLNHHA